MALTVGINIETDRTTVSPAHSSLNRQSGRWVKATLHSRLRSLTVHLYNDDRWELRFDAADGRAVLRGELGTNETKTTFEPSAEPGLTGSDKAAGGSGAMAHPLGVDMETDRTIVSPVAHSLDRQGDRWVKATLHSWLRSLTVHLYNDDRWELRFDAADGRAVLRGELGTNEFTTTFPTAEPRPKGPDKAAEGPGAHSSGSPR